MAKENYSRTFFKRKRGKKIFMENLKKKLREKLSIRRNFAKEIIKEFIPRNFSRENKGKYLFYFGKF